MKIQSLHRVLVMLAIAAGLSATIQADERRGLLGSGGPLGTGLGADEGILGTGIARSHRDDKNTDRMNSDRDESSRRANRRQNRRNENRRNQNENRNYNR
jgi:hypothetical protein